MTVNVNELQHKLKVCRAVLHDTELVTYCCPPRPALWCAGAMREH